MVPGIIGVYPQTIKPMRILDVDKEKFTADFNHPFAKYAAKLECRIQNVAEKDTETGGRLHHWGEDILDFGPGMQIPLKGNNTQYTCDGFYDRADDKDDSIFYSAPRFLGHVDAQASENLKKIYSRFLTKGSKVFDLMSSVQSHLPGNKDLDVTGLGLNMDELKSNDILQERIVHDLNDNPDLSEIFLENEIFDTAVCSLSIEYLNRPKEVISHVHRLLKPGGKFMIGLSNRWFPSKVTNGWLIMHEYERLAYLRQLMKDAGFKSKWGTSIVRNDWRPVNDKHYYATRGISDPVYVIWCEK